MKHIKNMIQKLQKKKIRRPHMLPFKRHSVGGLHTTPQISQRETAPRAYVRMAEEGYAQNIIVYRAVSLIARNLASVPWRLQMGDRPLDDHPLLTLIQDPNPRQTGVSFLESLASYLLLAGNSYVEISATPEADALNLYLLRPDRVEVVPEPTGHHYLYRVGGEERTLKQTPDAPIAPLMHLKMFHPLDDWYGMSALEAASSSIHQHNEVGQHNLAILQNGGRPSGALVMRNTQRQAMPEEHLDALRQELHTLFQGSHNAGRLALLEGDMDWKEMGITPKDLDFVSGKYLSAREIAQAYGVPAMLVGVPGDATFANYREARLHLWEDTILPLLDKIIAEMTRWLCPLYGDNLSFTYDKESIPALVARRDSLWSRMENCTFLTDEEKREALGYGGKVHNK